MDEEVKKEYHVTLEEFVHSDNLLVRDTKRGKVIKNILQKNENMVFAISPISYPDSFAKFIVSKDILKIELIDSVENIFNRLVFSDENDVIYVDDEYKNKYRNHYISEIEEDFK